MEREIKMDEFWAKIQTWKESLVDIAPPEVKLLAKTIEDDWRPICEPYLPISSTNKLLTKPTDDIPSTNQAGVESPAKLRRSGRKASMERTNNDNVFSNSNDNNLSTKQAGVESPGKLRRSRRKSTAEQTYYDNVFLNSNDNNLSIKQAGVESPVKLRRSRRKSTVEQTYYDNESVSLSSTTSTKKNNPKEQKKINKTVVTPKAKVKNENKLAANAENKTVSVTVEKMDMLAAVVVVPKMTMARSKSIQNLPAKLRSRSSSVHMSKLQDLKVIKDVKNMKGETALHLACIKNNIERVKELLAAGANPNTKDHAGWTPLHEVIDKKFMDIAILLLDHGASPNVPGLSNEIVLHNVVAKNQIETCKMLVERGADIHARNDKGVTPLDLATDEIKEVLMKTERKYVIKDLLLKSILDVELNFEIRILPSFLKPENDSKLKELIKHHSNIVIDKTISQDTSFLIVESYNETHCPTNINTLNAVALGIPIVCSEWLSKSNETQLAILKEFQLSYIGGYCDGIAQSYRNRLKLLPSLFDGCHFYFKGTKKARVVEISASLKIKEDLLSKLIINGGGKVLRREPNAECIPQNERLIPYHAKKDTSLSQCSHFILYSTKPELCYNMSHIKSLPIGWLVECIQNFMLIDTDIFFH